MLVTLSADDEVPVENGAEAEAEQAAAHPASGSDPASGTCVCVCS
jgi:hypothetical protein